LRSRRCANPVFPEAQLPLDTVTPAAAAHHATFNWLGLATAVYAAVAGMLLFRLAIGVLLTWRLARAATPISVHGGGAGSEDLVRSLASENPAFAQNIP
jgi:hypothetical protein